MISKSIGLLKEKKKRGWKGKREGGSKGREGRERGERKKESEFKEIQNAISSHSPNRACFLIFMLSVH